MVWAVGGGGGHWAGVRGGCGEGVIAAVGWGVHGGLKIGWTLADCHATAAGDAVLRQRRRGPPCRAGRLPVTASAIASNGLDNGRGFVSRGQDA